MSDYEFKDNKGRAIILSGETTIEDMLRSGADFKIEEKGRPLEDGWYREWHRRCAKMETEGETYE